ncbi:hypothetical protein ACFQPF_07275 [Fictibacillus iocasae]|uniref:MotA/TolQ/ExbB proton channel domain-containing protein n=1 Tax=Fictibacillus iocasae TaxID=2715437 RepID=A0ABW2NNV9_9BACL
MDMLTSVVVGLIGFLVFMGFAGQMQAGYRFRKWLREVQELDSTAHNDSTSVPRSRWLQNAVTEYRDYHLSGVAQLNTQALIEKHLFQEKLAIMGVLRVPAGNAVRLMQQLPSFTIILGVMGTFIGLTLSLVAMQDTLLTLGNQTASSSMTMNTILSALTAPFKGMSVAFITSIAGIGGALLLTILQTGFLSRGASLPYLQSKLMADTEAYLDHRFSTHLLSEKPHDSTERLLDRLASKVHESFHSTLGDFASQMVAFTGGLQQAMEQVTGMITAQREHTERFAESALQLEGFGQRFHETTEKLGSIQRTVDQSINALAANISSFEQQLKNANDKHQLGQQKFEQLITRSDKLLQESQRRSEEQAVTLTRALGEQLQHYKDQHDALENRLAQKQDEWHYRYSEKQGEYGRASSDFASSVQQLEKGFHSAVDHMKRDFVEQLRNMMDSQVRQLQQLLSNPGREDDMRELSRTLENMFHGLNRSLSESNRSVTDSNRTLGDMHGLLQRIYQAASQPQVVYETRQPAVIEQPYVTPQDNRRR